MSPAARALAALAAATGAASLSLSKTLGSHMVLQRDRPAVVFGFDTPGVVVTTTFGAAKLTNTTGADGIWRQALPPTSAGGPYNLTFASATGTIAITDVLFGDVWFCGGQSNMQVRGGVR